MSEAIIDGLTIELFYVLMMPVVALSFMAMLGVFDDTTR